MQSRLAYCPAWGDFWDLWRVSWTDWAQHAYQWQQTATSQETWLCARLLIQLSLVDAIPTTQPDEVSNFPETPGDLNFPLFFHSGDRRLDFCKEKCRFSAIFPTIFPPFFSEGPVLHPFFLPFFQPF